MQTYLQNTIAEKMLPILFENQGVWHLVVPHSACSGAARSGIVHFVFLVKQDWSAHRPLKLALAG
jgi:hypothetical protein